MNIVLLSSDDHIKGPFITHFLFMGFNIFPAANIEKLFELLNKHSVNFIILDVEDSSVDWVKLIEKIKNNFDLKSLFIIILHANRSMGFLKKVIMQGVNLIVNKSDLDTYTIENIAQKMMSENKQNDQRKFLRIVPNDNEDVYANIEIKGKSNYGYFKGKLLDLSVLGAAIKLEDKEPLTFIREKATQISTLQIVINKKIYFCDGLVLRKFNDVIVVKYEHINEFFKIGIADYISKKICL